MRSFSHGSTIKGNIIQMLPLHTRMESFDKKKGMESSHLAGLDHGAHLPLS
jgi:hypothetical protein